MDKFYLLKGNCDIFKLKILVCCKKKIEKKVVLSKRQGKDIFSAVIQKQNA